MRTPSPKTAIAAVLLSKPPGLPDDVSAHWDELLAALKSGGLLTLGDGFILQIAAETMAQRNIALREVIEKGATVIGANGGPIRNPSQLTLEESTRLLARLLGDLGLTPAGRRRLGVTTQPPPKASSKWAGILKIPGTKYHEE